MPGQQIVNLSRNGIEEYLPARGYIPVQNEHAGRDYPLKNAAVHRYERGTYAVMHEQNHTEALHRQRTRGRAGLPPTLFAGRGSPSTRRPLSSIG